MYLSLSLSGKIRALTYSPLSRKLFSTAEDGKLGVWDMDVEREEVNYSTL